MLSFFIFNWFFNIAPLDIVICGYNGRYGKLTNVWFYNFIFHNLLQMWDQFVDFVGKPSKLTNNLSIWPPNKWQNSIQTLIYATSVIQNKIYLSVIWIKKSKFKVNIYKYYSTYNTIRRSQILHFRIRTITFNKLLKFVTNLYLQIAKIIKFVWTHFWFYSYKNSYNLLYIIKIYLI